MINGEKTMRAAATVFVASLSLMAFAPGVAFAEGNHSTYNKTTVPGRTLIVDDFMDLNPDCSSIGYPEVRVRESVDSGKLTISQGRAFPFYEKDNERSRCNKRRVPATSIRYVAKRGFKGSETIKLEIIWNNGDVWTRDYNVTVK
jgi:hypothetical protein